MTPSRVLFRPSLFVFVLMLLGFVACLKDLTPAGAPCKSDADCWSDHFCVAGTCYNTKTPELATEPVLEPKAEPKAEPKVEPKAEPRTEPRTEPKPEVRDAAPEVAPELPPDTGPVVGRDLYQTCAWYDWSLPSEKCKPGFVCHRADAYKAYCLKDCTKDQKACDGNEGGRTTCRIISWTFPNNPTRACVSEEDPGKACDPSRGIFCKISFASGGGVCRKNTCVKARVVREGEACDTAAASPTVCDLTQQQVCSSKSICAKATPKFEGDKCDRDKVCPTGLSCVTNLRGTPICLRECQGDQDCGGYPHTSQCYQGVCVQTGCTLDFDCTSRSLPHLCSPDTAAGVNRCIPTLSGGRLGFGGICQPDSNLPQEGCSGTLRCFRFSDASKSGICLTHCNDDLECAKFDPSGGYSCSTLTSKLGFRYCWHLCNTDADCPKPFLCGKGICQPPP